MASAKEQKQATATVPVCFYEFRQNNSGGSFVIDDERGLGPRVWIEATDVDHACMIAERAGVYFGGVDAGRDCECCGDRWSKPWRDEGPSQPAPDATYDFTWHPTVYVHRLSGDVERITRQEG